MTDQQRIDMLSYTIDNHEKKLRQLLHIRGRLNTGDLVYNDRQLVAEYPEVRPPVSVINGGHHALVRWVTKTIDYEIRIIDSWYEERRALYMKQRFPEGFAEMTFVNCSICGQKASYLCSQCESAAYCSAKCQEKHWPNHKENC